MKFLDSMFVALAMYSKLPVPQVEWQKKTMAYALAFFPLVGVFCGSWLLLWSLLAYNFVFDSFMWAAGVVLGPLIITGGIHLDGFCDVTDALSSWQTRERRLEILKDSHIGAFALIGACCYLLLYLAVCTEIEPTWEACNFIGLGYILCRTLSGLSIVRLRCAKTSGLAASFAVLFELALGNLRLGCGGLVLCLLSLAGLQQIWWHQRRFGRLVFAAAGAQLAATGFAAATAAAAYVIDE